MDRSYPIGKVTDYATRDRSTLEAVAACMEQTAQEWRSTVQSLPDAELNRTYREGSWTMRELVHHAADAHMHGLIRLKYGLVEDGYVIKPMEQQAWLGLADTRLPPQASLDLLEALNLRWGALLRGLDPAELGREVVHPQEGRQDLWRLIAKHDWHLRHHLAHVRLALEGSTGSDHDLHAERR
ncbi:hypothetical protein HNR42_001398 [Deinobacterium chartae]|uniref:DinB-like domain-containing protein n=1 Tax=Deinobacterium chartae TaxID=521158 RepID=A0A841I211_9DEIO|nr:putative metal-dependent hydrolase [Deinobacterium chartae]MBB6097975.1 hypothetical protein [Deinobacterium chartae]